MSEKLQKVLARAGLGSRREIEGWILQGRIHVNRQLAKLGDRVNTSDKIHLDGRLIACAKSTDMETQVILYHKLEGEVCSRDDEQGRRTVFLKLPRLKQGRWVMIGRLDINTSGLLLFTNNGELAHRLMHPSYQIEREYAVRVYGRVRSEILEQLQEGVMLEDGPAHFERIVDNGGTGMNHWYHVFLREGRNHEVRRLWESQNLIVSRLVRVGFAGLALPRSVRPGKFQALSDLEIEQLMKLVSLDVTTTAGRIRR